MCSWVGTQPMEPFCASAPKCLGEAGLGVPKHEWDFSAVGLPRVLTSSGAGGCACGRACMSACEHFPAQFCGTVDLCPRHVCEWLCV